MTGAVFMLRRGRIFYVAGVIPAKTGPHFFHGSGTFAAIRQLLVIAAVCYYLKSN